MWVINKKFFFKKKFACLSCKENYFDFKKGLEQHHKRAHKIENQMNKSVIDKDIAYMESNLN